MTASASSSAPASVSSQTSARWWAWLADWVSLPGGVWCLLFSGWFYSFTLPNNPAFDRLDILQQVPDLLLACLFPQQTADRGWHVVSERIPIAGAALGIGLAALCLGRLALRLLGVCQLHSTAGRFALAGGLGLSLLSLLTLAAGLAGSLSPTLFLSAGGLLLASEGLLTALDLRRCSSPENARHAAPLPKADRITLICALACIPYLLVMLSGALLPSLDFDVNEYHLEGPKEYFLAGRITYLPHNVYTSFPFLTEMLTLTGMVCLGDWYQGALVGKTVLMLFAPITAAGIMAFVGQMAGPRAAWLGALIYLSTPWTYRISIIAYTEGAMCAYVMLTLLAVDTAWRASGRYQTRCWLLVGLLAGSAASTKYPGVVFVIIPAGLAWLCLQRQSVDAFRRTTAGYSLSGLISGVLLAFGPWLLKNAFETGNPVFPLAGSILGGADWDAELHAKFAAGHAAPVELFGNPVALVTDLLEKLVDVTARSDWQSSLVFALAPWAIFAQDRRRVLAVAGYALLFFLMWLWLTHRIDRFWVPVQPVFCILAALGAEILLQAWLKEIRTERFHVLLALAGGILLSMLVGLTLLYNLAFMTSELCGPNMYLTRYSTARQIVLSFTPLIEQIEQTPELQSGKVLLVGEAQVFDLTGQYDYNTVFDRSLFETLLADPQDPRPPSAKQFRSPPELAQQLSSYTHVAVNWMELLRYRTTYGYTDFVSPARLQALCELGLLEQLPIPAGAYREFDRLSPSWQAELEQWGPELLRRNFGERVIPAYTIYRVKQQPPVNDTSPDAPEKSLIGD